MPDCSLLTVAPPSFVVVPLGSPSLQPSTGRVPSHLFYVLSISHKSSRTSYFLSFQDLSSSRHLMDVITMSSPFQVPHMRSGSELSSRDVTVSDSLCPQINQRGERKH